MLLRLLPDSTTNVQRKYDLSQLEVNAISGIWYISPQSILVRVC